MRVLVHVVPAVVMKGQLPRRAFRAIADAVGDSARRCIVDGVLQENAVNAEAVSPLRHSASAARRQRTMSGSANATWTVHSSPATNLRKVSPSPRSNSGWPPSRTWSPPDRSCAASSRA